MAEMIYPDDFINKIVQGDCLVAMKLMPDNCVDSIVTDPPAGIGFMGKEWDKDKGGRDGWITWLSEVMAEARRVLKPGGHALVWSLPRTSHWTGTALELAGFEIRDCVYHLFGSGFPKSLNIGKAIDKLQGNEREQMIDERWSEKYPNGNGGNHNRGIIYGKAESILGRKLTTTKGTSEWEGWGTALKPAVEVWWLCRKPLSENTVAENVLKHSTGGLNIDGCRVGIEEITVNRHQGYNSNSLSESTKGKWQGKQTKQIGRFPSHLIHDGSDVIRKELEEEARFFYTAKPSSSEKNLLYGTEDNNGHPTVKSQALMQYLIKLITPPKGIVLDPFTGSGSTLLAAQNMGHSFIGIELDSEYCKIAEARLKQQVLNF